jgi:hypothetical protein
MMLILHRIADHCNGNKVPKGDVTSDGRVTRPEPQAAAIFTGPGLAVASKHPISIYITESNAD